jgi:transposase
MTNSYIDTFNLPDFHPTQYEENEHFCRITGETANPPTICPSCESTDLQRFGVKERLFPDLPHNGKPAKILLNRQRYRCKACNATFMDDLPGMDENYWTTSRLVKFVERESLRSTFVSVAENLDIDEKTVRSIFKAHVARLDAARHVISPRWLGMDEKHLLDTPRFVIADVERREMVDMLKKRDKTTVINYISKLPGRGQVELVAIDMWKPYRDVINMLLPQAEVVVDKFHVLKLASKCFDDFRRSRGKELEPDQALGIKRDAWLLRTRFHRLTASQRILLDAWLKNVPLLEQAYLLREAFYDIYEYDKRDEAEKQLALWKKKIEGPMADIYTPLLTAVTNWKPEIFNYFEHKITNAYTEALNGLIDQVNHAGRGYSFEAIRAKMIYFHGTKIKVRPDFGKVFANILDGKFCDIQPCEDEIVIWHSPSFSTLSYLMTIGEFWNESMQISE